MQDTIEDYLRFFLSDFLRIKTLRPRMIRFREPVEITIDRCTDEHKGTYWSVARCDQFLLLTSSHYKYAVCVAHKTQNGTKTKIQSVIFWIKLDRHKRISPKELREKLAGNEENLNDSLLIFLNDKNYSIVINDGHNSYCNKLQERFGIKDDKAFWQKYKYDWKLRRCFPLYKIYYSKCRAELMDSIVHELLEEIEVDNIFV